jgi:hypothetical protein
MSPTWGAGCGAGAGWGGVYDDATPGRVGVRLITGEPAPGATGVGPSLERLD